LFPCVRYFSCTQVLTSTHEDKAYDYDFDHDGLANEDTEEDNAAGPLMGRANPLYSFPAPSVDIDANIMSLTDAWTALANARSDHPVEGLLDPLPSSPVGTGEESHVDAAHT
jgi:pyrimidine and pyridine-specific 5'-nucleotidase